MKTAIPALLLGAALVSAGACESRDEVADVRETAQTAAEQVDDGWITTKVEAKFFTSPEVKGREIDVSTENGIVTLAGEVEGEQTKQQALALARDTEGVRQVRDELRVSGAVAATTGTEPGEPAPDTKPADPTARPADPTLPDDSAVARTAGSGWITTKIQAKYFMDGDVKGRNLDINTRDGVVTISGRVEDEAERQKAIQIARDTEGVTDVKDNLRVGPEGAEPAAEGARPEAELPTDEELVAVVQSRFYQDDELRGSTIGVTATGSVVTLSGTVPSEARKRQAVSLARNVDGVTDVRDELRVDPTVPDLPPNQAGTQRDRTPALTGEALDGWITTKIQSQFYLDPDIKGRNIDVKTSNGVVTLTGTVDSEQVRQQALTIARQTEDVSRVQDKLTVK